MEITLESISEDISKSFKKLLDQQTNDINEVLEKSLRNNATPLIKGKLTKGKLKWRGIKLITNGTAEFGNIERWIEQRGKRISPVIIIEMKPIINI